VGWVTGGRCDAASPDACGSTDLWITADGGASWTPIPSRVPVASISPLSDRSAWAIRVDHGTATPAASRSLVRTDDAGMTWRTAMNPCANAGMPLWSIEFPTSSRGWAMCVGEPATDLQPKELFSTQDGGSTWRLESSTCVTAAGGGLETPTGALPCTGYLPGMAFLRDGHGLLWMARGTFATSSDAGRSWTRIAPELVTPDVNSVTSATLINDQVAEAIIWQANEQFFGLFTTADGGQTWTLRQTFPVQ
jgi:photosystem II stability/assembly factor-like uncharacterized protein